MLRVMYKNAQLPIILATMARRRDLSDLERGDSGLPGGAVVKGAVLQRQLCHQSPWVRAQALS